MTYGLSRWAGALRPPDPCAGVAAGTRRSSRQAKLCALRTLRVLRESIEFGLLDFQDFRQLTQFAQHISGQFAVHADGGERLATSLESGLVILADIDARVTNECTNPADYTRYNTVSYYPEQNARIQVDVKANKADNARIPLGQQRSRNAGLGFGSRESHLDQLGEVGARTNT